MKLAPIYIYHLILARIMQGNYAQYSIDH